MQHNERIFERRARDKIATYLRPLPSESDDQENAIVYKALMAKRAAGPIRWRAIWRNCSKFLT
jgi:hypothetical protein